MEVHHHAHTARKKWTHYFWEFLMLFLAVFCGFFAEYQLEHKIEKERGKQYIRSFYEDLLTDSTHFNELIAAYGRKLAAFAGLSDCYDSLQREDAPKECLEPIVKNTQDFPDMIYTDRTLLQLKNAGGLRLLKPADADSILLYDNLLRKYKVAETSGFQEIQSEVRRTASSLFNFQSWEINKLRQPASPFYGDNPELQNRYFNQIRIYSLWCWARNRDLLEIKKRNASLIGYFKKRYHYQ